MCEDENWTLGSLTAVIVAVFVASGWFGPGDAVQIAAALPALPALLDGACACFDPVCVCL